MTLQLTLFQRAAVLMLSLAAPARLAPLLLRPPSRRGEGRYGGLPPGAEPVAFASGEQTLRGWWLAGTGGEGAQPRPAVVLAHGWSSHALRMMPFAEPLLQQGYDLLLYSARSHGESDPYPYCSLAQFAQDVTAAVGFARGRAPQVALLGHSLGGAASLVAAADGIPVLGVASVAALAHPARLTLELLQAQGLPAEFVMRQTRRQVEQLIGRGFVSLAPELRIAEVDQPVLLIHGSADEVVPVDHFHAIRSRAGSNVDAMLVEGAGHDSIKQHPLVQQAIAAFFRQLFATSTG